MHHLGLMFTSGGVEKCFSRCNNCQSMISKNINRIIIKNNELYYFKTSDSNMCTLILNT